jgi:tRNA pseudouridine38-40 synthase
MLQTYKIILSYDGTDYYGWQKQPQKKTVQGELEKALYRFKTKRIPVMGAGRTDAGVHAMGQVAHFHARLDLSDDELLRALNGQLPSDIRIASLTRVDRKFHARKSALSKVYQYRICNHRSISPFDVRYVLHWPPPLEIEKMQAAASLFIREADFSTFSSNRQLHPVRRILRSEITRQKHEIVYTVEGTGFLKYMVRTMVGTLLEVAKGRLEPHEIEALFEQKKRSLAAPTAPAKGLCLIQVNYQEKQ